MIKLARQNGKSQFARDLNYLFKLAEKSYSLEEQNESYRKTLEKVLQEITHGNSDVVKAIIKEVLE